MIGGRFYNKIRIIILPEFNLELLDRSRSKRTPRTNNNRYFTTISHILTQSSYGCLQLFNSVFNILAFQFNIYFFFFDQIQIVTPLTLIYLTPIDDNFSRFHSIRIFDGELTSTLFKNNPVISICFTTFFLHVHIGYPVIYQIQLQFHQILNPEHSEKSSRFNGPSTPLFYPSQYNKQSDHPVLSLLLLLSLYRPRTSYPDFV